MRGERADRTDLCRRPRCGFLDGAQHVEQLRFPGSFARHRVQMLKQLVGRGNDVLDLRASLCFQKWQCVDQHRGIREQFGSLLQLGKRRSGRNAPLQDQCCFQLHSGRQAGLIVVGPTRPPAQAC